LEERHCRAAGSFVGDDNVSTDVLGDRLKHLGQQVSRFGDATLVKTASDMGENLCNLRTLVKLLLRLVVPHVAPKKLSAELDRNNIVAPVVAGFRAEERNRTLHRAGVADRRDEQGLDCPPASQHPADFLAECFGGQHQRLALRAQGCVGRE